MVLSRFRAGFWFLSEFLWLSLSNFSKIFNFIIQFVIDDFGVMTKSQCQGQLVYDINFCVRVCSLQEGEQCSRNPTFGDNLCSIGTKCSHESSTCERLPTVRVILYESYTRTVNCGLSHDVLKSINFRSKLNLYVFKNKI